MSLEIHRVVAAVDGSAGSVRSAQAAADIARPYGASLLLVTVVRPPEGWWGLEGSPPSPKAMADAIVDARREVLDTAMDSLDLEGVEVDTVEEVGDPATVLLAMSAEADLLVLGRRGAGLVERLMLGSVADRVAHESACPVMIVP